MTLRLDSQPNHRRAVRIAMWSGPRNISTAMMRAWENRRDTLVVDEPLYAHYLRVTGKMHPGREETLAAHDDNWNRVTSQLVEELPAGKNIVYQKHMAHHLLPGCDQTWMNHISHGFLIRDPEQMLVSLSKRLSEVELEDTGLPQQARLFRELRDQGRPPIVLDARDVLIAPEMMLQRMCQSFSVEFDPNMMQWPSGPRPTDGAWAPYWYDAVWQSTTFAAYETKNERLRPKFAPLLRECLPFYELLFESRLQIPDQRADSLERP